MIKTDDSLKAVTANASATTTVTETNFLETTYSNIKNIECVWRSPDYMISSAEGTCTTNKLLNDQDVYVLIDDTLHPITSFDDAFESLTSVNASMTSNTFPEGTCASSNDSVNAYKAFDRTSSTVTVSLANNPGSLSYDFANADQYIIEKFYLASDAIPNGFFIEGSNDGTNFATISIHSDPGNTIGTGKIHSINSPGMFQVYRLSINSSASEVKIENMLLLDKNIGSVLDTSAFAGTPSNIFIFKSSCHINQDLIESARTLNVEGSTDKYLNLKINYNDTIINSNTIDTTININVKDNEFISLNYDTFINTKEI